MTPPSSLPRRPRLGTPTASEIAELAQRDWLEVSADEAEALRPSVSSLLATVEELLTLPPMPPVEPEFRSRSPGRRPTRDEDPFNVFTRLCEVRGADEGLLAGKSVGIKD